MRQQGKRAGMAQSPAWSQGVGVTFTHLSLGGLVYAVHVIILSRQFLCRLSKTMNIQPLVPYLSGDWYSVRSSSDSESDMLSVVLESA